MEREQLERCQATLRGLRDSINTTLRNGGTPDPQYVLGFVDSVAGVVLELIDDAIVKGEHAHAVAEIIKRPGEPRMALAEAESMHSPTSGYPGSKVEPGGKMSEEQDAAELAAQRRSVLDKLAKEPDSRD